MKLYCLGACREVGRSAFVVETDKRILLDYGIKIYNETNVVQFPLDLPFAVDLAVISHAHLDHSGFVPALVFEDIPWYSSSATRDICKILWEDSIKIMKENLPFRKQHAVRVLKSWRKFNMGKQKTFGSTEIYSFDAGHILGALMLKMYYSDKTFLYTGDFKLEPTRMHNGANIVEDVDTLVIDSTYALTDHPERKRAEMELIDEITETLEMGGTALLPAFAVGRTQELISVIRAYLKDTPIFVDGMGRSVSKIYEKYSYELRDGKQFRKDLNSVHLVENPREREHIVKREPCIVITSAGMMNGGPVLGYLKSINRYSKILITGYTVEGTNGWKLLNKGYVTIDNFDLEVSLPVKYIDFSAHASRTDILNFIKWANPEKIIVVHSDVAKEFEVELKEDFGFDAVAPKAGDVINL